MREIYGRSEFCFDVPATMARSSKNAFSADEGRSSRLYMTEVLWKEEHILKRETFVKRTRRMVSMKRAKRSATYN